MIDLDLGSADTWGDDGTFEASIHAAAIRYAGHGWAVFPLQKAARGDPTSGKKPAIPTGYKAATTDIAQIEAWFGPHGTHRGSNIGIACEAAGIVVLDIDVGDGKFGVESLNALLQTVPDLSNGAVAANSGGGGIHIIWRAHPTGETRTRAAIMPGLDIRAQGGYIVAPPSRHHSGGRYHWRAANPATGLLGYPTLPTASVPDAVHSYRPMTHRAAENAGTPPGMPGFLPKAPIGTEAALTRSQLVKHLEIACLAILAAPNGQQQETLNRESFNTGKLCGAGLIPVGDAMAALIHAALSMVSHDTANPWTPRTIKGVVLRGLLQGFDQPHDGFKELEPPHDLAPEPSVAAHFPVEALPKGFRRVVEPIANQAQAAPVMAVQAVLAACSTVAMMLVQVVRPGSIEAVPASLMLAAVADSGERKTAAEKAAFAGIREYERQQLVQYWQERQAHETALKVRERAENEISRARLTPQEHAERLAGLGPLPQPPQNPAMISEEPTVAALEKSWELGCPGQAIITSEGGKLLGGYDMGGTGKTSMATTLSAAYDGTEIRRHRAKDSEPLVLYNRALTVFLAMQPNYLPQLMDAELREQGLLSRMLIAMPPTLAGARLFKNDPGGLNTAVYGAAIREFNDRTRQLLGLMQRLGADGGLQRTALMLSDDAQLRWVEYYNSVEIRRVPGGDYRPINGFASKIADTALRVAAILHAYGHGAHGEVALEAMESAIAIADWFMDERIRLQDMGAVDTATIDAQALLDWLMNQPSETTTRSEISRRGPNRLRNKPAMERALAILVQYNQVRIFPAQGGSRVFTAAKARQLIASSMGA